MEIWTGENSANAIIFPRFPNQIDPLIIRTHTFPSDETSAINSLQAWVDDSFWENILYKPDPHFSIRPNSTRNTFRHSLASLSRSIFEITKETPISSVSGTCMAISASMIPHGTLWDLKYLPELANEAWQQALLKFPLKDSIKKEETPVEKAKSKPIIKKKKQDKHFGCYMWPPVWLGEDFWLDVRSYVIAPVFRRVFFPEELIGKSTFIGNPLYFSKNGKLYLGTQLTREESLLILNKLMFTLRFLVGRDESKRFNNEEIYPVSANELCTAEYKEEKDDDPNHLPKITRSSGSGAGDRGFWVSEMMERRPVNWKDNFILIMEPQEFAHLIELSSRHYENFETEFSFNENILHLLSQSANHSRNNEFLSGFILGFFALERVLSEIWRKITIQKLIIMGMSKSKARSRLKDGNWTLSLMIDGLTLLEVISSGENQIIHKMRKLRNSLAHGGKGDELLIDKEKAESVLKWCMRFLRRVNLAGDIVNLNEELEEDLID